MDNFSSFGDNLSSNYLNSSNYNLSISTPNQMNIISTTQSPPSSSTPPKLSSNALTPTQQRFDKLEIEEKPTFGKIDFEQEELNKIKNLLKQKLGPEHTKIRPGPGGKDVPYVESHKAVELANEIFDFNGWGDSIVDITPDFIEECSPGRWRCAVTCVIRITLKDGSYHEDVGFGCVENANKATAIENSKKEAVSDARKRAFRLFGNYLGNSLYDKNYLKNGPPNDINSNNKIKKEIKQEIKTENQVMYNPRPLQSYLPPSYNPQLSNIIQNSNSNPNSASRVPMQSFSSNNSIPSINVPQSQPQPYSLPNSNTLPSSNSQASRKHLRNEDEEDFEAILLMESEQIENRFYSSQNEMKNLTPLEKKRKIDS